MQILTRWRVRGNNMNKKTNDPLGTLWEKWPDEQIFIYFSALPKCEFLVLFHYTKIT